MDSSSPLMSAHAARFYSRKICRALTLAGVLTLILLIGAPAERAQSASTDGIRILQSDASAVVFEYNVPSYSIAQRTIDGTRYDVLSAPNSEPSAARAGAPQLPTRGVLIAVPQGARVSLRIVTQQAEQIAQPLHLLPVPTTQLARNGLEPQNFTNAGQVYSEDASLYAQDSFVPAQPAQLGTPGHMRSQRFVQVSLFPFQYNAAQQRVRWLKSLTVELRFAYDTTSGVQQYGATVNEGPFESVLQAQILNYSAARAWRAEPRASLSPSSVSSAPGSYKLVVNQSGLYRVTYAALAAAGLPAGVNARTLKILKNGVELPIYVKGESDGSFDPGDYLEFYAEGLVTAYTETNVYWFAYGGANGLRMATRDVAIPNRVFLPLVTRQGGAPSPSVAFGAFRDLMHIEENHVYVSDRPSGVGDHWFWNAVTTGYTNPPLYLKSPTYYPFTLTDVSTSGNALLRINVFGAAGSVGAPLPHHMRIYMNGTLILDDAWAGDSTRQVEASFAASLLLAGTNTITLELPNDTALGFDGLYVNWFELEYAHPYVARSSYLAFASDTGGYVQPLVTNFGDGSLSLYDVTNPTNPVRLTGFMSIDNGGSFSLNFGDNLSGPARYVAFGAGGARAPQSITRITSTNDLLSTSNGADEIIITADDFYNALQPLVDWRQAQGLRVLRVRISDVYDQFNDGVFDPMAIRTFLEYAYNNWQSPAPLYVLLVGDGNLNYRNFTPTNIGPLDVQYIPPYMAPVDPYVGETASENRFVTIVGDDLIPDMAIGRLPVRTAAETTAIVNKIIAFEQSSASAAWRQRINMYSDNYYTSAGGTDSAGDFYASAEAVLATIPSAYNITRAYYDPAPVPPNPGYAWHYTTVDGARNAITTTFSSGAWFVNYVGHAAQYQWASEALMTNEVVVPYNPDLFAQVNNGERTPIVLELTCRTGNFFWPGLTTLAESFVRASGRGAVADWSSSGLGVNQGHDRIARAFYSAVFSGGADRLGLAINAAKAQLVADGAYFDLVDEFTLFGDPALLVGYSGTTQLGGTGR